MIITKSPLRVSIGGGGTDLPFYYREEGGLLVTAAIDKYITCVLNERFEDKLRFSYPGGKDTGKPELFENDIAGEVLKQEDVLEGVELSTMADAPSGAGLGSSGTFTVGMLRTLREFRDEQTSDKELAEKAFEIEHDDLGHPCGKQDQYASAFGGIVALEIDKDGSVTVDRLNLEEEVIEDLEKNIQLFYTGTLRDSSEILEKQKKELSKDEKMEKMRRIKSIGKDIREALESGELREFGELLHKHWETKKKFTGKMSNPEIDSAYREACEAGAIGGKIMGAGGGGFFMFYVDGNHEEFKREMESKGLEHMNFKFDWNGSEVVYVD